MARPHAGHQEVIVCIFRSWLIFYHPGRKKYVDVYILMPKLGTFNFSQCLACVQWIDQIHNYCNIPCYNVGFLKDTNDNTEQKEIWNPLKVQYTHKLDASLSKTKQHSNRMHIAHWRTGSLADFQHDSTNLCVNLWD